MSLLELLRDPLFRSTLLTLWLLPCAIQDRRTRHVSNWLTVPLFVLAWPAALVTDHLPLTLAVFAGVFLAWRWSGGLGPADGKIAVGLAGLAPSALLAGVIVAGVGVLVRAAARAGGRGPARRSLFLSGRSHRRHAHTVCPTSLPRRTLLRKGQRRFPSLASPQDLARPRHGATSGHGALNARQGR